MSALPAWEVPVRPTVKHRQTCGAGYYCNWCEYSAADVQEWRILTDAKSHRAPTHAKPYSEDAEHAAAWRSELLPARTSRRGAAA